MKREEMVPEFDIDNFELSSLLCTGSVALDNHRLESANEEEYQTIAYISDLILRKSRDIGEGRYHPFEDLFFWEFYGKEKISRSELQKVCADRLTILSEELRAVRDMPSKEVEKTKSLTDILLKLTRATQTYWVQQHPDGFKHYATA